MKNYEVTSLTKYIELLTNEDTDYVVSNVVEYIAA